MRILIDTNILISAILGSGTPFQAYMGISLSTGSACNSHITQISHVLQAIRLPESLAKGTIRISLGKNNTIEDVNAIVTALKKITSS